MRETDIIPPEQAGTLAGLLRERVARSPQGLAYRQFQRDPGWIEYDWQQTAASVGRWQAALQAEGLAPGDRVAILLRNCFDWVCLDLAAHGLGLVVVPLYTEDRAENIAYVLANAGVRLLLIQGSLHWQQLSRVHDRLGFLERILSLQPLPDAEDPRLRQVAAWLPAGPQPLQVAELAPDTLASIVYTSGTTGQPKGVMLSHRNILWNAWATLGHATVYPDDRFLSFLPLSHTFERTVGYYLPMMAGAGVIYNRSIPELAEDLLHQRPTIMVSVPRIYERVYNRIHDGLAQKSPLARRLFLAAVAVGWARFERQQGRGRWHPGELAWPLLRRLVANKVLARLGGRLRLAVCGGAPLPPDVAQLFIGLGLPLLQGYGLTETSPVIAANRVEDNLPASIGRPLRDVEVKLSARDELCTRSPGVMLGYWENPEATAQMIDDHGWLHTGDIARIDAQGHLFITGRIKEIIVLANGEKVPPADMEMAISGDSLVEQVMVLGDNKPFLTALLVLNPEAWAQWAEELGVPADDAEALRDTQVERALLARIADRVAHFPGYARVRRVALQTQPWTVEDGLITPTLKLRRQRILEQFSDQVDQLYAGH